MPATSSFVGRAREQHLLSERLSTALAGQGNLVLVSGDAGIGKTSLVSVVTQTAHELGAVVLTGACYDLSTTPPYGPWTSMFAQHEVLNPLSPHLNPEHVTSQLALFEEVATFVRELSSAQPLVLVLEDLHWSDLASLELLRYLGRQLAALPVLLITTYRSDELTRKHPLFQMLPLLVREALAERIDLQALDDDEVRFLVAVRYMLADINESGLVGYLQEHAEGNPFFLNELLRTLESERLLQHSDDGWLVRDLERAPVPPLVRQVIERRLGDLGDETRRQLELAAVVAQVVPIPVWQAVSGATDDELLETVELGIEAHLLAADAGGSSVRFEHALTREALYEGILPLRRRVWHGQIGETLVETSQPDPDAVAYHFLQAGDERAIDWTIRAADRAELQYAWVTASERFETAIRLMDGLDDQARERGWLLHRLGMALRWTDPERGVAYHEEAIRVAEKIGNRDLLAVSRSFHGTMLCFMGRAGEGIDKMMAGAAELDAIPADKRQHLAGDVNPVAGTLVAWLSLVGRHHEAIERGERFMAQLGLDDDRRYTDRTTGVFDPERWVVDQAGSTCTGLGISYAMLGRPDEAIQMFNRARELFLSIAHHGMTSNVATLQLERVALPYRPERLAERNEFAGNAEEFWGRARGALPDDSTPRVRRIPLMFVEGVWDEASTLATRYPLAHSNPAMRVQGTVVTGSIARHQGDPDSAWQCVYEMLPYGPASEPGELDFLNASALQRIAVELALDASDLPLARAWLEACDRWLNRADAVLGRAAVSLLWANYHAASGDEHLARQCAESALELASEPRQPLALLAIHRFLGRLAIQNAQHTAAGDHLSEALALADACAAPFERALTLVGIIELRIAAGNAETVPALVDEARAICATLGAQPTLDRLVEIEAAFTSARSATSRSTDLSPRELEVLQLIALGKTDREIAEDLFISRHTVMRHVSNILNKLGVESRTAATAHAVRHNLA